MVEEAKKPEGGNGKLKTQAEIEGEKVQKKTEEPTPAVNNPKNFKIAEIWIKDGTVALDACPDFWMDKLRSCGILDFCKDIVKQYNPKDSKKVITGRAVSQTMNTMNRLKNRITGAFGGGKKR